MRSVGQNRVMCLVMWSACQTRPVRVHERRAGRTGWHGDSCGTTRIVEGHDATCEDRGVRDGLSWCLRVFVSFSGPNLRKCMNVGLERAGAKMAAAEATRVAEDREPHAKIQAFVISHDFSLQIAISRWILRFRRNQRQEGLVLPYEIMEKCSRACVLIISS